MANPVSPEAKTEFAQWLVGFRSYLEQTQEQFAESIDSHRDTVSRWERGTQYPDWHVRIRLNGMARTAGYRPVPTKR